MLIKYFLNSFQIKYLIKILSIKNIKMNLPILFIAYI